MVTQACDTIEVKVLKDGEAWTDHTLDLKLVSKTDTTKIYELDDEVPDGDYVIYNGVDSLELNIEIKNDGGKQEVNFYTLTLNKDEGINSVTGEGVYLKGKEVDIAATAKEGYTFTGWSGDVTLANSSSEVTINGEMTLLANSKKVPISQPNIPTSPDTGDSSRNHLLVLLMSVLVSVFVMGRFSFKTKKRKLSDTAKRKR